MLIMKKVYTKVLYLLIICILFVFFYYNTNKLIEEIKSDNNTIRWGNELLEKKIDQMHYKKKSLESLSNILGNLPFSDQLIGSLANLQSNNSFLSDLSIKIKEGKKPHKHWCDDNKRCLLSNSISASFTCDDEKQIYYLIEAINSIKGTTVDTMSITELDAGNLLVNITLKSYYYQIHKY